VVGSSTQKSRSHADDPPAAALGPHDRCHRSGLFGQIDQDPRPRGRGAGLVAERPFPGPIRGGRLGPLVAAHRAKAATSSSPPCRLPCRSGTARRR
jgi:hypothetical protein